MKKIWIKRLLMFFVLIGVGSGFAWMLRPQPLLFEFASVKRDYMETTVSEEGISRFRDVYTVSAPAAGRLSRISLRSGDHVERGLTVVANILPADSAMLDPRTRLELERSAEAAKAARDLADAEVRRATAQLDYTRAALDRSIALGRKRVISEAALEKARSEFSLAVEGLASARAQFDLRQHDLEAAEARLLPASQANGDLIQKDCCVSVIAPVSGTVLTVHQESETVVTPGTALLDLVDNSRREVAVDLLSQDAVLVAKGARARIGGWGGPELSATVREINPMAFTKISALGIEEQRVTVLLDYDVGVALSPGLGHNFRVEATIVTWSAESVLQVPVSALIRQNEQWALFVVENGTALQKSISVGAMNGQNAEVKDGLLEGEQVILYPSELLGNGSLVAARPASFQ